MSNITSNLKILDLYNDKIEFHQSRQEGDIKLKTGFNVNYFENKNNDNQIKVQLETIIKDDEGNYKLSLSTVGIFELDKNGIDEETAQDIIKANTVAIMFPYIRSQISLLTTQPGIQPIMIPPININSLLNKESK